jgi:hypothetical protein
MSVVTLCRQPEPPPCIKPEPVTLLPPSFAGPDALLAHASQQFLASVEPYRAPIKPSTRSQEPSLFVNEEPGLSYNPAHTSDRCACENIVFEDADRRLISEKIEKGQIPLLQCAEFPNNHESKVQCYALKSFHLSAQIPRYVAISHVRSQALGNTQCNSLPRCQLLRLQALVNNLYNYCSEPIPFWIDTICVPLKRDTRRVAIKQMCQVFKEADQVLALDLVLSKICPSSIQECFIGIKGSAWCKRLWTVQEGTLARKLRFQFLQGAFLLSDILRHRSNRDKNTVLPEMVRVSGEQGDTIDIDDPLTRALELLVGDFKSAYGIQQRDPDSDRLFRKRLASVAYEPRIRAILRLGCLSVPRHRSLLEGNESAISERVVSIILDTYSRKHDDAITRWTSDESLLCRLGNLSALAEHLAIPVME